MFKHALLLLLVSLLFAQMVPVETPQEVKIDLADSALSDSSPDDSLISSKIQVDKIYEVDATTLKELLNRIRNVVVLVYKTEHEEEATNALQGVIPAFSGKNLDIIFVKMPESGSSLSLGIHLNHLGEEYHFANFDNLQSNLAKIILPTLAAIPDPAQVQDYFAALDANRVLVLTNQADPLSRIMVEGLEALMQDGSLKEAHLDDIKAFEGPFLNFTPPAILLKNLENHIEKYQYNVTHSDTVLDFFYVESLPALVYLNENNYARVFGGPVQTQIHLLLDDFEKHKTLIEDFTKAALNNKRNELKYQRLLFTISRYADNKEFWELFDFNSETKVPQLVISQANFRKYQVHKYVCKQEELNYNSILQFIQDFRDRRLEQYYKSEPVIEKELYGNLTKVVGQTFTDQITKRNRNVLLLYWDSKNPDASTKHFQMLEEFIQIANNDNIVVACLDLALNEHPKITIDSAPKIFLYLQNDKKNPKEYLKSQGLIISELKNWLDYWLGTQRAYNPKTDL